MPSANRHAGHYRPDIDGLRAIAILSVLAFHAFPAALPGGFVGVDVFFVISGFLITGLLLDDLAVGRFSLVDFYARRIRRIFPALIVVLAACLGYGWFALRAEVYALLGEHTAWGAGFASNLLQWSEVGYFNPAGIRKPLLHLWSLGIEEQYYLVWPLLLWLAWRLPRGPQIAIGLVLATSLVLCLYLSRGNAVAAFYSPYSRFWELAAGAMLAIRAHRMAGTVAPRAIPLANAASLAGLTLIVAATVYIRQNPPYPDWRALLPVASSALLVASGPGGFVNRALLSRKWMVGIGLVSYPLYLWHWPIFVFQNFAHDGDVSWPQRLAGLALAFVLAIATFFFIEKPIRFGMPARRSAPVLFAAMLAIGLCGAAIAHFDGFPAHFRGPAAPYGAYRFDYHADARSPQCWLPPGSRADAYAPECIDPDNGQHLPLVLLWGDSHAGRLYPGLRKIADGRFRIAQFTRSSCAPNFWTFHPRRKVAVCAEGNIHVMRVVQELHPDVVVLFAYWSGWKPRAMDRILLPTVHALRQNGARRVIVVGPAPAWRWPLPNILFRMAREQDRAPPMRMSQSMETDRARIDADMRAAIERQGEAEYVSAMDAFCDARGCLTRTGQDASTLTTWDYGHLTTHGAEYLARRLPLPPATAPAAATPDAAPATMR
ncbi:acyltransferase family protein [Pseudoluteimonas lycopersici]|nr:acyltransferase family protein [Lysobacter lycopersici]